MESGKTQDRTEVTAAAELDPGTNAAPKTRKALTAAKPATDDGWDERMNEGWDERADSFDKWMERQRETTVKET